MTWQSSYQALESTYYRLLTMSNEIIGLRFLDEDAQAQSYLYKIFSLTMIPPDTVKQNCYCILLLLKFRQKTLEKFWLKKNCVE